MIRALERGDSPALSDLLVHFFRELDPRGVLFAPHAPQTLTALYTQAPSDRVLPRVFADSGELAAFILARVEERPMRRANRILFLDAAYTLPDRRGRGYMLALVDDLRAAAKKMELSEMELATPVTNEPALRFWRERGFRDSTTGLIQPI